MGGTTKDGIESSRDKWRVIALLSIAELLAMSLWFSASAAAPALMGHWQVDAAAAAWLTMAVQLGFVMGALTSALLNLPDVFEPRKVVATGAFVGALANGAVPFLDVSFEAAVVARFVTGASLALVYPVGMKIMATWTREDRGLGIGILVGALTLGSAMPHLTGVLGGVTNWRLVMLVSSAAAVVAALIALVSGHTGPYSVPARKFEWKHMTHAVTDRPIRLANLGYLGHMWELYAMWTWIPVFAAASFAAWSAANADATGSGTTTGALTAFVAIASGAAGSVVAGKVADRKGRTWVTSASMIVSGGCCMLSVLTFGQHPLILIALCVVWGFTIVSDSAQFSSSISELANPQYMGTQLTTQTAMGFLLTMLSIRLLPAVARETGWRWAFLFLIPGPMIGTLAMQRLRRLPDAARLAGGRR